MFPASTILLAFLLILPTHQSVPEEGNSNANSAPLSADTWRNSDDVEYYVPSAEERESLYRDLRSLRLRNYKPRSSFPYYKGLGK